MMHDLHTTAALNSSELKGCSAVNEQKSINEQHDSPYQLWDDDVYCGRGTQCYNHIGNQRFRSIIKQNLELYFNSPTRYDKSAIIDEIIHIVENKCFPHGGLGFVKKDTKTGQYYQLSHYLAREKTSQAFCDAMQDETKAKQQSLSKMFHINRPKSIIGFNDTKNRALSKKRCSAFNTDLKSSSSSSFATHGLSASNSGGNNSDMTTILYPSSINGDFSWYFDAIEVTPSSSVTSTQPLAEEYVEQEHGDDDDNSILLNDCNLNCLWMYHEDYMSYDLHHSNEYVTQDRSVVEFGTLDESRTIHTICTVCPAKSRTLKDSPSSNRTLQDSPGSTSTTISSNRKLKESPASTSTTLGSNRALKRSASTGTSTTSKSILLGAIKGASSAA
jgi:hypothetical protein